MKNPIVTIACAVMALFVLTQPASAGPVTNVIGKTEHFVHKAGQKIDEHLIQPSRREFVNHTRRARAHLGSG